MSQEGHTPPPPASPSFPEWTVHLDLARWGGGFLAAVGVIVGLLMAFKRREAPCPDGKYFPEGTTDFQCYVHPQAMQGVAVIVISLLLGILLLLACAITAKLGQLQNVPAAELQHPNDERASGTGDGRSTEPA